MPAFMCKKCGLEHPRGCKGHRSGIFPLVPCRRSPLNGQKVCKYHGGAAPQTKRRAAKRIAEEELAKEAAAAAKRFTELGLDHLPDVDPLDALLLAVTVSAMMVNWLRRKVSELEELWAKDSADAIRAEVHVDLLRVWTRELGRTSKAALDADLNERVVRLAERQADLLIAVIDGVLEDLDLTARQQKRAPDVVRRRLTLVSA